ncbi:helix-turn-helix transcriptional regulator [Luteimonas sp. R10]|uniref:helix-turn-helix transcriptional regulator n=1 Tax=Luteimonas sp. R10 TaxID=3108176 RepID=UPI0030886A96|nr:AraC family transcriptional regulator [Luteimonas sp. R10]
MTPLQARTICSSTHVRVRDVHCRACRGRHAGQPESVPDTRIVLAYRGTFVYRPGRQALVADGNQALVFNAGDEYRIDHPGDGGDRCLSIRIAPDWLQEIARDGLVAASAAPRLRRTRRPLGPRDQWLAARLRACDGYADPLPAETLTLALAGSLLQPDPPSAPPTRQGFSAGRGRLIERAKLLLQDDPAHRWTLAALAAELRVSPVYLTQSFSGTEGMPLYRYQTRLRLARALEALPRTHDLTALALTHGFSSHGQFSAAFRRTYGLTPSAARRALRSRPG